MGWERSREEKTVKVEPSYSTEPSNTTGREKELFGSFVSYLYYPSNPEPRSLLEPRSSGINPDATGTFVAPDDKILSSII